jgi:hypothetical protein
MTNSEYAILSKELQSLSKVIPLNWGKVQNDSSDSKVNMFACTSRDSLEAAIKKLSLEEQDYFRYRWFLWKCSQVDEYLFYKLENVRKNPDHKDQSWDIEFDNSIPFDVKGTVVPKSFRNDFVISKNSESQLIRFYYEKQSKGIRYNIQNRLFIVHHSFKNDERSRFLRCHWDLKNEAYQKFNQLLTDSKVNLRKYKSATAKCIFIIENIDNDFHYVIV